MSKSLHVSSWKSLSSFNTFVLVFLEGFLHCVKRHAISTLFWISYSHSLVCLIVIVIIFRICFRVSLNCWNKKHFSILCGMLIKYFCYLPMIRTYFLNNFIDIPIFFALDPFIKNYGKILENLVIYQCLEILSSKLPLKC